jgi:menaquinone-dependent protoporphyrinogen oxidase
MKVLVTAASRHGSTQVIADAIGEALKAAGMEVAVEPPDEVLSVDGFDAVVLGSAVYMGRWLEPAKRLAQRCASGFAARPVWLFSSGPMGEPPKPAEDPVDVAPMMELTHAREHRVFPGAIDRSTLGFAEKAIVAAVRAPEGDFRPWDQIESWARSIARALHPEGAPAA